MDRNSSIFYVAQVTEEGSIDCSVDWDTFSFQNELEMRHQINKEHAQYFKLHGEAIAATENDDDVMLQVLENRDIQRRLLENSEATLAKYELLLKEHKNIEEELEKLTLHNKRLQESISKLSEEETTSRKEYQQHKGALQQGVQMYSYKFDLDVDVRNISETEYEALIYFGNRNDEPPIKFTVDRAKRQVIDFNAGELLLPDEEEGVRNKFGDLKNLPGLLCELRDIALSKRGNINKC